MGQMEVGSVVEWLRGYADRLRDYGIPGDAVEDFLIKVDDIAGMLEEVKDEGVE